MVMDALRRRFLASAALAAAAAALPARARAQGSGTARLLVGFSAGGMADSVGRMLAAGLARPEAPVVVDNRPGASGQLAVEAVRQAAPDGQALLLTPSSTLSLVPQLYRKHPYDSVQDFTPVAGVCDHAFALAVAAQSPIRTFSDYVAAVRANPAAATYGQGGGGPGSAMHFLGTILSRELGVPLTHVTYKGTAQVLQDLIGGQLAATVSPYPAMLEMHRAQRIRILAISNPARIASLPDVPTFTELGLPAMELVEWYGVFASSKVAPEALARWERALLAAVARPEAQVTAQRLAIELRPLPGEALRGLLARDLARWAALVKETGLTLDS